MRQGNQATSLPVRIVACGLLSGAGLAACGGGGGGSGGGTPNSPPTADAGVDRTVVELSNVELNGSATDPDGGALSYAWTQTGGSDVTLSNASSAQAGFEAPDVAAGAPEALTFRLTVTDDAGTSDSDEVRITVQEPGDTVTISGVVNYEFVPANPNCIGLNYTLTEDRPIRGATVRVLDASSDVVLGQDVADDQGTYEISIDPGLEVYVRVRAELKRGGAPSWDVEVRDNTSNTGDPLKQRPLYVLDSGDFDSGLVDQTRNLTATTGWNGTSYASTRAAAPFAILDSIYEAMQFVLTVDAQATFTPLDVFWSVNNRTSDGDVDSGAIGTSFYRSDNTLFLLGQEDDDTEEFDDHVIVHEWGHYFEDEFSRSDSIGGPHGIGDRLDMRVAFGEGWATALSGMALDNPVYCDTLGPQQGSGFEINIENDSAGPPGWFNELSILALLYDLWDTDADIGGADTDSIGFGPIFETMTQMQPTTAAYISIYTFAHGLKSVTPADSAFIDALLAEHDIDGTGIYGGGETNDSSSGGPDDVLPVYTEIVPDGTPLKLCSNRQFDGNFDGNRLSEHRFLHMEILTQSRYEFDVVTDQATVDQLPPDDPTDPIDQSDPDILFYLDGVLQNRFVNGDTQGLSGAANRENFTTPNELVPDIYALDVVEFRHKDDDTDPDFPERSCFDITITPAP